MESYGLLWAMARMQQGASPPPDRPPRSLPFLAIGLAMLRRDVPLPDLWGLGRRRRSAQSMPPDLPTSAPPEACSDNGEPTDRS